MPFLPRCHDMDVFVEGWIDIMRKTGCVLLMLLLLVESLAGCGKKSSLYVEMNLGDDEIFLYSVVDEKIGIYNTKKLIWTPIYVEENTFQYVFQNDSEYIVSGNSIENGFVLLKRSADRKSLKKLFELNNDKNCFFPLATNGNEYYFVMYVDEKSECVERDIFTFTEDYEIRNILKSNKKITAGIMLDDILYYTAYDDLAGAYKVFLLNVSDIEEGPKILNINRELQTRDLFFYKDSLCVSDYDNIYTDSLTMPKKYANFIEQNYLIQFFSNEDYDMVCTVTDISSGDCVGTFFNPINYEIVEHEMIIYCQNGIYTIEI